MCGAVAKSIARSPLPPSARANTTLHPPLTWQHAQATRCKYTKPSLFFNNGVSYHTLHCWCRTIGSGNTHHLLQTPCCPRYRVRVYTQRGHFNIPQSELLQLCPLPDSSTLSTYNVVRTVNLRLELLLHIQQRPRLHTSKQLLQCFPVNPQRLPQPPQSCHPKTLSHTSQRGIHVATLS
ncbi:hypothetical protein KC19_VG045600 [Ceratodon purpureus]|uniref:Uncharacterized protein n=1 Tax=Ceratodon purpureus TaxID=3225 RepID=A0A8T0HLX8_CERPU|nr:hypothetical protein KC19_VG045600 [Ceratodon purpureus]